MFKFAKTNPNNKILNQLVSENCLSFGRSPKLNNKKITHYLSGTRQKVDIFNLYEMRYLLLKVYPLIHNLFLQQRLNVKKKKPLYLNRSAYFKTTSKKLPKGFHAWKDFWKFHAKNSKPLRTNIRPLLPKILFATTTELYSEIVSSAARNCHMPFHVNRWLSGTITASSKYLEDFEQWSFLTNNFHKTLNVRLQEKFFKQKKNIFQQAKKIHKYQVGRKPSLILVPDVSNNEMIIKETKTFGIPVLGLVSSNCNSEIAYPIFANDFSIYSIHFFCHFLSSLIAKELFQRKHKLYIAKKRTRNNQFQQTIQSISRFKLEKWQHLGKRGEKEAYSFEGRYFLDGFFKPRKRIKKNLKYKKKKKTFSPWKVSTNKLIFLEDHKRLGKIKNNFFWKKRILKKIGLLKSLRKFNLTRIVRQIRMPAHKPKFRFWNQSKFFFSKSLKLIRNTQRSFQMRRFLFPKFLKKIIRAIKKEKSKWREKIKRRYRSARNKKIRQRNFTPFRKRWSWKEFIKKTKQR